MLEQNLSQMGIPVQPSSTALPLCKILDYDAPKYTCRPDETLSVLYILEYHSSVHEYFEGLRSEEV